MRVFIAYSYNPRDQWIKELVMPILRAFRVEVVTGEQTYGGSIPDVVLKRIRASDALIAFTTRRDQQQNQNWTTHYWVVQEMAAAIATPLPVVEVRELGVDPQAGMQASLQRIEYDEEHRDTCLVKIVEAIGNLRFSSFEVQLLLPESDMNIIGPLARKGQVICSYRYREGFYKSPEVRTEVEAITGGLFVVVKDVPAQSLVKFSVEASGRTWSSGFENLCSTIQLR
jgi:hypothetical protein